MPEFKYKAINEKGKVIHGLLRADDESTLEDDLMQDGFWLIRAKEQENKGNASVKKVKLKRRDLIELASGMAPMLAAGIPLVEALDEIKKEARTDDIHWLFMDINRQVQNGSSFSEALGTHPDAFPVYMRHLIRAGEQSGNLVESFAELSRYLEWVDKLAGQIKQASIYPISVLVAISIFILLLFTFVVPRFASLLTSLDIALPLPTRIVMSIGDFMAVWWWLCLLAPLLVWLAVRLANKYYPPFVLWLDKVKLSLPVFGEINTMLALSRFSHHFATLFRAGIPLLEVLQLTRGLVGNEAVARSLDATGQDITEGSTMLEAMRRHGVFPPMLLRMIAVGENTGEIDAALSHVATFYDNEIPQRINRLFAIIEPVIILTLVAVVGGVALAIFLPMMGLMGAVG